MHDVSIVIVNWNTRDLLLDCLASVYATLQDLTFEIWLVDNASSDDSIEAVRNSYPEVKIIANEENLGFGAANNCALRKMDGRYALLLNTDAVLTEGAVGKIVSYMDENEQVAMACGQLLNADGSRQNSIANFPTILSLLVNESILRMIMPGRFPSKLHEYKEPLEVESCIGACLMVRKKAIDQVGLLDERYFFFFEETDWAMQMHKAGWSSVLIPDARIYHLQGQSAGDNIKARIMFYRSRYQYLRKWYPLLFPIMVGAVILRLSGSFLLNLIGFVVTIGLSKGIRRKLSRYAKLLFWHLQGCPA